MYENKILYGLDKIHYCKKDGVIKQIKGAIDIEISISQEYKYAKKGGYDSIRFNAPISGKGTLNIIGLTLEEKADLLGYTYEYGELSVGISPNPPNVSLLFARQLENGGELYTIFYNCVFENTNINAVTDSGELNQETATLNFDVLVDSDRKLTYFALDTKQGNQIKVDNFFKQIQVPNRRN